MTILDSDLANVIQADRRQEATRERLLYESITTERDTIRRFTLDRLGGAWLRQQMARRLTVSGAPRQRDPTSLETV